MAQEDVCIKLFVVKHENGSAGKPLTVELAPYGFAPACVGYSQVNGVLAKVVPEYSGSEMSHGIQEVMSHHLGLARCAAGEVHQHGVGVVVLGSRAFEFRCRGNLGMPVVPAARVAGITRRLVLRIAYLDQYFHRWAFGHGSLHLAHHVRIIDANYGLHAGSSIAIYDVMFGKHVGGWYYHGRQFVQCQHGNPPFVAALEN